MKQIRFLGLILLTFFSAGEFVRAGATPDYSTIFYYREGPNARASLYANPDSIDVLAPQTYALNIEGQLKGSLNPEVLAFAKEKGIKLMPLITNGAFSRNIAHTILDDQTRQDLAISQMITEAEKYGYWGWQVDFEQMDVAYRDKFSAFIKRVGKAFQKHDLILSVAVVAKISDRPKDYKNRLWPDLIGVFDYSALAKSVDFISLMSYDDPDSKGPVARYAWLRKVIAYSLKKVPPEKLSLGIPFYYWQWNDETGKLVDIGGRNGINYVLQTFKVKSRYSTEHQAPYLTFLEQGQRQTLWYENDRSVKKKISLIKQYGLHGFSAWAIGLELASVYSAVE